MNELAEVDSAIEFLAQLITELESSEYISGIVPAMRHTLTKIRENVGRLRASTGYPVADCEVREELSR
jgi:hypothetical protein